MGGGLMQLAAIGPQDIYLTGNPQITYFKVVYKRHTNFAIETINMFTNDIDFGNTPQIDIPISGDLVGALYLEFKLPQLHQTIHGTVTTTYASWVNGVGNALVKSVSLKIGSMEIDKHYSEWLDIWGELNVSSDKKEAYNSMVGNTYPSDDTEPETVKSKHPITVYIPLRFWFNTNPGLALPLIALQYHKVTLHLELEEAKNLIRTDVDITTPKDILGADLKIINCNLLIDYIYLDTDERRRFTQVSHEYLIERVQYSSRVIPKNTTDITLELAFNNPVKYITWVVQDTNYTKSNSGLGEDDIKRKNSGNQKLRYSCLANINGEYETFKNAKIQINGYDRITERNAYYFRVIQNSQFMNCATSKYIYSYSFALNPGKHQPSGTCNFSRLDDVDLVLQFDNSTKSLNKTSKTPSYYIGQISKEVEIKIFAVNYNILRIVEGTAGLAYSN